MFAMCIFVTVYGGYAGLIRFYVHNTWYTFDSFKHLEIGILGEELCRVGHVLM